MILELARLILGLLVNSYNSIKIIGDKVFHQEFLKELLNL